MLFIRSLLLAFFFKLYPQLIEDGRIYISESPLYRISDKKDPFVLNKQDYIKRYVKSVSKEFDVGKKNSKGNVEWFDKHQLKEFLYNTANYVSDISSLAEHYKVNEKLLDIIFQEMAKLNVPINEILKNLRVQYLMNVINETFPELYFDDKDKLIKGVIDAKYQLLEINTNFVNRCSDIIDILKWVDIHHDESIVLKNKKTATIYDEGLLFILKILTRYQPDIIHRYKGSTLYGKYPYIRSFKINRIVGNSII